MKRFIIVALIFVISNARGSNFLTIKIQSGRALMQNYLKNIRTPIVTSPVFVSRSRIGFLNSWSKRLFYLFPNPPKNRLKIRFEVPCFGFIGRTNLKILDISGKTVRVLLNRKSLSGSYIVSWNGKDRRGVRVSSGTYFCCLSMDRFGRKTFYIPFRINKRKISGFRRVKRLDRRKNIRRY